MTTPPEVATFKIVACGTCDNVFRTHPGRPSCPMCGGEPDLELGEGTIETPVAEEAATTEAETPAPAGEPAAEPAAAPIGEPGQDFDEVEKRAQEAKATAVGAEAPSTGQEEL